MLLFNQMVVLFILMGIGYLCYKKGIITDEVSKKLSAIVVNIANALHTTVEDLMGQETKEGDPELEYYRCQRAIARNAKNWSQKQKADLVNALFDSES